MEPEGPIVPSESIALFTVTITIPFDTVERRNLKFSENGGLSIKHKKEWTKENGHK